MVYSGSGINNRMDGSALPGYVVYLVLLFQLIIIAIADVLLAGWVGVLHHQNYKSPIICLLATPLIFIYKYTKKLRIFS